MGCRSFERSNMTYRMKTSTEYIRRDFTDKELI